tara:strand:+ start:348 stop:1289 length:942 start_codon:yes stop_codon:yes gene_type:complete
MMDLNVLYCFDSGYNTQTVVSINSILHKIDDIKLNVYIIHKNPETFTNYKLELINNPKIGRVEVYKFNRDISNYPNLANKHVSEATYYRLFISEYLPKDIDRIIYLDSDVFCLNNPTELIDETFNKMNKDGFYISVSTEIIKENKDHDLFVNLELEQDNYFNAGVMLIDYQRWLSFTKVNEFISLVEKYKNNIIFWDQDILNKKFDGKYYELPEKLNFRKINENKLEEIKQNNYFIHYVGNHKPWTIEGGCEESSIIYFEYFKKVFNKKYHFEIKKNKINSLYALLKNLFSFKFLNSQHPFSYIKESLKTIIF